MGQVYRFTDENGQVRLMAEIDPAPGGGPTAGTYLPTGNPTGVTVDSTTYDDPIAGGGAKLVTLVFPDDQGALGLAVFGDAHPRVVLGSDPTDVAFAFGDGSADPLNGATVALSGSGGLNFGSAFTSNFSGPVGVQTAIETGNAPQLAQISPLLTITSGALPTLTISSGTGRQILTSRDCETVTPFTGDGTNNVASCAIALSADNSTYSTLATISIAAALNLTGVLTDTVNVRVPAGWYVKLTASHGTIGTTTYY